MSRAVFITLNEYQYWIACAVARKLAIAHPVLILMGEWTPFNSIHEFHRMPYTDMRQGKLRKLLALLASRYAPIQADSLYIPSNLDPYINKLVRSIHPKHVYVFDEGGGAVYSYLPPKKWHDPRVLLGWTDRKWGVSNRIGGIFSPNPEIYAPDMTGLVDIAPEMRAVAQELYQDTLGQVERDALHGVVVLTQPYPADYLGSGCDGNHVLFRFATERWDTVFVKAHPRELPAAGKHGKLVAVPTAVQRIPMQAIALTFAIDAIVSNCSSALLNTAKIANRPIAAYSLIGRVPRTKLTQPFLLAAAQSDSLTLV